MLFIESLVTSDKQLSPPLPMWASQLGAEQEERWGTGDLRAAGCLVFLLVPPPRHLTPLAPAPRGSPHTRTQTPLSLPKFLPCSVHTGHFANPSSLQLVNILHQFWPPTVGLEVSFGGSLYKVAGSPRGGEGAAGRAPSGRDPAQGNRTVKPPLTLHFFVKLKVLDFLKIYTRN